MERRGEFKVRPGFRGVGDCVDEILAEIFELRARAANRGQWSRGGQWNRATVLVQGVERWRPHPDADSATGIRIQSESQNSGPKLKDLLTDSLSPSENPSRSGSRTIEDQKSCAEAHFLAPRRAPKGEKSFLPDLARIRAETWGAERTLKSKADLLTGENTANFESPPSRPLAQ